MLRALLLVATLAAILGAKFDLIDRFGSDLPYWDQWDGEGDAIYRPYLQGKLKAVDFFRPHNEHRIVPTLLMALGIFELNDHQWDGRLQMTVNTFLHAAAALLLVSWAWRWFSLRWVAAFAGLVVIFFSTAVAWENTLSGFQSQFYFLLLFSLLHLAATLLTVPGSWRWYFAPSIGLIAIFSMASGLLSAIAILGVTGLRCLRDRQVTSQDGFVLAANAVLTLTGFCLRTRVASTESLLATSFGQWFEAWLHQLAWPVVTFGFAWFAWIGLVPPLLFLIAYWRRNVTGCAALFLLGMSAWVTSQTMAIAYARGAAAFGYSPRYGDILNFNFLVNVLLLGFLALQQANRRIRMVSLALAVSSIVIGLVGLRAENIQANKAYVLNMPQVNAARLATVRSWLTTHDRSFFDKAPWTELPFPEPHSLSKMLDQPLIQATLPPSARTPPEFAPRAGGVSGFVPRPKTELSNPPPNDLKAWMAPAGSAADFQSIGFSTTHAFTSLYILCETEPAAVEFKLVDRNSRALEPLGGTPKPSGRWRRLNFEAPPGLYCLEVNKTGPGEVGFTQPFSDTRWSRLTPRILGTGPRLKIVGFVLIAWILVLALFLDLQPSAAEAGK